MKQVTFERAILNSAQHTSNLYRAITPFEMGDDLVDFVLVSMVNGGGVSETAIFPAYRDGSIRDYTSGLIAKEIIPDEVALAETGFLLV